MFDFKRKLFIRKVINSIAPNVKNISDIEPLDSIMIKIFILAYTTKTNRKFKYINRNKICLYEICLLAVSYVRWIYYHKKYLYYLKKEEFDCEMLSYLISGFEMFFKSPEISEITTISMSRLKYYDEVLEKYIDTTSKNDFICIFDEFKIIIKAEILKNQLIPFQTDSQLYLLATLKENSICEVECSEVLKLLTSHVFDDDILKLIKDDV